MVGGRRGLEGVGLKAKRIVAGGLLLVLSATASIAGPLLVKESGLTVGSDLTYPPFSFLLDGKPSGFDVELMEKLAERMNLKITFIDTRFVSLIAGLKAGHFDAIASALYITPERQKVVDFIPYSKAGASLLVLKNSQYRPASEHDLCGRVVGSIQGAAWLPRLKSLSNEYCLANNLGAIESREYGTDPQATQALRAGAVEVQIMDSVVAAEVLGKFSDDYALTSTSLIYPILVGIAVDPQNKQLISAINNAFATLRKDGIYQALVEKYGLRPVSNTEIDEVVNAAH